MTRRATYAAACGGAVRVTKAFLDHQAAHPVDMGHLSEAIAATRLPKTAKVMAEVDLGRTVGRSHRIRTEQVGLEGGILAARRNGRLIPSRVVVGIEPEPTPFLTFVAKRSQNREFALVTAFYGRSAEPEPHDRPSFADAAGRAAALAFWSTEALIWVPEQYGETPFRTTWKRMLSGMWVKDAANPGKRIGIDAGPALDVDEASHPAP